MIQFVELYADQGADFTKYITLADAAGTPLNISGYTITSNAKASKITPNVAFSFAVSLADPANGNVAITLSGNTSTMNVDAGEYVYDLKAVDGSGVISKPVEGIVYLEATIT